MKHFFYESEHFETIEAYCNNIIAHHDCHKEWAEFVEEPELLEYLNTKHIYWNENFGHILVKNNWAQPLAVKAMHIYLILKKSCSDILGDTKEGEKWQLWTYKNRNHPCAVIDNDEFSLDILYRRTGNGGHSYQVQLFKRDEKVDTEKELSEIAKRFCFKYDSEIGRYSIMIPFDDSKVIDLIRGLYKQEYNLKK